MTMVNHGQSSIIDAVPENLNGVIAAFHAKIKSIFIHDNCISFYAIYFLVCFLGVSPMGIFWSMVQAPGQKDGLRLMKKDMDTPMIANISLYNSHVSADAIHKTHLNPMCTTTIERWYKAPGVKTEVIRDGRLRGVLYLPPGN